MKIIITFLIVFLCSGCAGGFAALYSVDGKRKIECTLSAGGLGQILHWSSEYEGKPAEVKK